MVVRASIILLLFGLLGDRGPQKGREGNTHFEAERYAAATATYKDGLEALADTTGAVYTGLQNNRGLALHRQGRRAGVESTPTLAIGRRVVAPASRTAGCIGQLIEEELAGRE